MEHEYHASAVAKWEFAIDRNTVYAAAQTRLKHHTARHEYWTAETEHLEQEMRNKGLTFIEFNHSGGRGMRAELDDQMSADLSQANKRREHHSHRMDLFDSVITAISETGADCPLLPMTLADFRLFGLVSWPNDED